MAFLSISKFNDYVPGEKELYVIRKHRLVYLVSIIQKMIKFIIVGALLVGYYVFGETIADLMGDNPYTILKIIFVFLYVSSLSIMLIREYVDWFYDNLILTNRRVIHSNQHFIWGKDVTSVYLSDILNITALHKGVLSTIFKYGTVNMEISAGAVHDIHQEFIPNHEHVVQLIQNAQSQYKNQRLDPEELAQQQQKLQQEQQHKV